MHSYRFHSYHALSCIRSVRPIFDGSDALRVIALGYTHCENGPTFYSAPAWSPSQFARFRLRGGGRASKPVASYCKVAVRAELLRVIGGT
jgi:hypothetical protein